MKLPLTLTLTKALTLFAVRAGAMRGAPERTLSPTLEWTSHPASADPCTGNTLGWKDSFGDDCHWYRYYDLPGCPHYGDRFKGAMGVANDNCCYCAGTGAPVFAPSPTEIASPATYPTDSPTIEITWTYSPETPWPTQPPQIPSPTFPVPPAPQSNSHISNDELV
mmetsp:Transcript_8100/g.14194  ORF Transcript_8100/g.14194 Transcript_8100/m.14194 type:complete len:165 (-) Transcript_8100:502-996(-)|eukprot:CAMPEP_0183702094 /NCGR_PEP_ID=MMETSP0737-20130205/314_1 /TAXON_ID=385413 /ORGANISM="Thalassiosira miniscula, Strain CCMP1093" /LENGTH=164 /DNA_ID=CAMNT_0025928639 /DNA_START=101 /DNA_END=595 /DNA_ORIENTATION=+